MNGVYPTLNVGHVILKRYDMPFRLRRPLIFFFNLDTGWKLRHEHTFMFSYPLEGDYVQGCGCVGERAASRHPRCECGPAQGQGSPRKGELHPQFVMENVLLHISKSMCSLPTQQTSLKRLRAGVDSSFIFLNFIFIYQHLEWEILEIYTSTKDVGCFSSSVSFLTHMTSTSSFWVTPRFVYPDHCNKCLPHGQRIPVPDRRGDEAQAVPDGSRSWSCRSGGEHWARSHQILTW